jgi:hypothetical protein
MVVTYARPFLESNEAGLGRRDWPKDGDRALHDELVDLRHQYHAHATHTPRRTLLDSTALLGESGRPIFVESHEELPTWKLRAIADLASRYAEQYASEAETLDVELWGPHDDE